MRFVSVPGIYGSSPEHWQSLWEPELDAVRITPKSWNHPELDDWVDALGRSLTEPSVIVAHSLGTLTTAAYLGAGGDNVLAALMVAPPDPDGPGFPPEAPTFHPPYVPLGVPAVVVASDDDPYATLAWSRTTAAAWEAELVELGRYGHINAASGLGAWPEGRRILDGLLARIA